MADLPPLPPAIVCSIAASASYGLPANIMLAVSEMEGGRPGLWVRNGNGTYDVGPMQFNTAYLKTLEPYGITGQAVAASNCYPYELAAWRVQKHIREDSGDLWTRVANYHSRTPRFNAPYRMGLIRRATHWGHWLASRFKTYEMPSPLPATAGVTPVVAEASATAARRVTTSSQRSAAYVSRSIAIRELQGVDEAYVPRTITIKEPGEGLP
jgi:hypothetical protein